MAKSHSEHTTRNEAVTARRRICQWPPIYAVLLVLLLADGCKKTEPAASAPQATAVPASTAPPAPTKPVPTFSAAQTIGMFVYPKANQTYDQQLVDEFDCYNSVQQQTGIDPKASGPKAPSSADLSAAAQQGASQAQQAQGGRLRGAARGAAGGAAIGAITGNSGRGAAIGATVGTVRGGRQQRRANEATKETGAQAAVSQQQQAYGQSKAAYNQRMGTFKRGFSTCMDARGYSVK
jgi:Glycine-zipper domain